MPKRALLEDIGRHGKLLKAKPTRFRDRGPKRKKHMFSDNVESIKQIENFGEYFKRKIKK